MKSPFVFGTGIVGWSDMASIQAVRFRSLPGISRTYLVMLLRDGQALRARQNTIQAVLYWLNGYPLLWPRAVVVNDTLLRMPSRELLGRMQVRYGPELARYRVDIRGDGA